MEDTNKSVPLNLVGVWQRESIQISDGEPYEDSRVLWLQTPYRYADMRVPLPGEKVNQEAFAGDQEWTDPLLTFNHDLDFAGTYPQDAGLVSWDGEMLIESGSANFQGETINYVERWQRCTPINVVCDTWEVRGSDDALQAIAIKVGDYAILMTSETGFASALFECDSSAWNQTTRIGREIEDHPPWDLGLSNSHAVLRWQQVK